MDLRGYTSAIGSDVDRDGMYLEVRDGAGTVLEVFYSDATREFTLTAFRSDLPVGLVEAAISTARQRLTPRVG